jgi:hypothetical protein
MTDTIAIAFLLLSVGWLVTALTGLINVRIALRHEKELRAQAKALGEVVHNTNGIQAALVASERKDAFAEGVKSEHDKGQRP